MKRYLIIIFAALFALSCAKEQTSYIDLPSINQRFTFSADGGKTLGTVISNTDFEMTSDSPWCIVTRYEENSTSNFRIDVEENLFAVKRKALITVSAEGCLDRTITVRQNAADPILSADKKVVELGTGAASIPLEITSNVNLSISMPEWISLEEGVEIKMGRDTYTFLVEELDGTFRKGEIILKATDYDDLITTVTVQQLTSDLVIFEDDFSWSSGADLCHSTSGEKRWDSYTGSDRPDWTTTTYTGAGSEVSPTPAAWMRNGYVRMNYAKRPSDLVTPRLTQIIGTANLIVSFKACRYQTSAGPDGYHEIHISCLGAGTVETDTIIVSNCNNLSADEEHWYTSDESLYSFKVTGATAQTQIVFHFGPMRNPSDNMSENMTVIPDGEKNSNCRMGFDEVKIITDVQ